MTISNNNAKTAITFAPKIQQGFPNGPAGKETACNAGKAGLSPRSGRPLEEGMTTPPVFLLGKSHGQRRLMSPLGPKGPDMT